MEYERESAETDGRYPLLPAQTALGCARLVEDDTGEVVQETLVLPNLAIYFHAIINGYRVGYSIITSPDYARQFLNDVLPERAADVTECDCQQHEGRSMILEDLTNDLL